VTVRAGGLSGGKKDSVRPRKRKESESDNSDRPSGFGIGALARPGQKGVKRKFQGRIRAANGFPWKSLLKTIRCGFLDVEKVNVLRELSTLRERGGVRKSTKEERRFKKPNFRLNGIVHRRERRGGKEVREE